jgi:hypothetical protein
MARLAEAPQSASTMKVQVDLRGVAKGTEWVNG